MNYFVHTLVPNAADSLHLDDSTMVNLGNVQRNQLLGARKLESRMPTPWEPAYLPADPGAPSSPRSALASQLDFEAKL